MSRPQSHDPSKARAIAALVLAIATGVAFAGFAGCQGSGTSRSTRASSEAIPTGRLPTGVRPIEYALEIEIDPSREDFAGRATIEIELDAPHQILYLHGLALDVVSVTLAPAFAEPLPARWDLVHESGVAAIRLPEAVGPGTATLRIGYRARFDRRLRGLYRVEVGADAYAFTQFEPTKARLAFPGFDEPRFKTPFDVTLIVPARDHAIANTPARERTPLEDGRERIRFAPTPPLPTYLVAWAVGPFDLEDGPALPPSGPRTRTLPFRGVAVRGRGPELRFALDRTPALLENMERYFGSEHPYAKLDVISVPDFGSGAMENAGAITFRDALLLLDPKDAPEWQRRAFTYVMAHELAHQWFGNLVTMEWWDDLWLNESFATWMGRRSVAEVAPEQQSDLQLLESVHGAMRADSQVSARSIRQPIESHHDIHNAFDPITYSKGAGVLAMFENWLGDETFRLGIRRYLARHRLGNATEADLLSALTSEAGRDVATPFRSFLTQPGVPFLEIRSECSDGRAWLHVEQSRYLPIGSEGKRDAIWQVPFCVRAGHGSEVVESCHLVTERAQRVELEAVRSCADWVMPNARAAGYYRFALDSTASGQLLDRGWQSLVGAERLSVAMNLEAAFRAGALDSDAVFAALAPLAADPDRLVAESPMGLLSLARENLVSPEERAAVEAFARRLYAERQRALGWDVVADETGEDKLLRRSLIHFLAFTGRDQRVRSEALRRGRIHVGLDRAAASDRPLDAELVDTALSVAVQDGGAPVFDALESRLQAEADAIERARILRALGSAHDPALADRARALALDPRLRVNEVLSTLWSQSYPIETRHETWSWVEANFDALVERAGPERARSIPWLGAQLCSEAEARDVDAFLAPRIEALAGGPRNLAGTLEAIRLCDALVERQAEGARRFFARSEDR